MAPVEEQRCDRQATLGAMTTRVPLNDLKRHHEAHADKLAAVVGEVVSSGRYILGPRVKAFESAFAQFIGTKSCVAVASGTDALILALKAVDCASGDRVLTVANAGMYATTAILTVGATPVYVEIDEATLNVDVEALSAALRTQPKAVIVTHLYGRLAPMEEITALCRQAGTILIEDCAQAVGARRSGKMAGAWGDLGCFSFYPSKNLGAMGDAGAVVTDLDVFDLRLRCLRQFGWGEKYNAVLRGGVNSRMDELQAAVLLAKLPLLEGWNSRRREIVERYRERAANPSLCIMPADGPDMVAHLCVARCAARDAFRRALEEFGVATEIHYPIPDHRQPALQSEAFSGISLPMTERAAQEIMTLPCFPEMTDTEIEYVAGSLAKAREMLSRGED